MLLGSETTSPFLFTNDVRKFSKMSEMEKVLIKTYNSFGVDIISFKDGYHLLNCIHCINSTDK